MIKSKIPFLFSLAILIPALLTAQLNHFIYLQTEGKQPFYAKLDKKVMSSSASGYLIIPKLKDGSYNITIGFPKGEGTEQTYTCGIDNKDAGFLIKNFGEKGWGLFNLQTLDIVMGGTNGNKTELVKTEKTDEFSNMLSEVVNDPSIKKSEKINTPIKEVKPKQEEKLVIQSVNKSTIVKKQLVTNENGVEAIYIDINGDKQDTIMIMIPADKKIENDNNNKEKAGSAIDTTQSKLIKENKDDEDKMEIIKEDVKPKEEAKQKEKKDEPAAEKKFLPIDIKASGMPDTTAGSPAPLVMINSDCKAYAADDDFLKLRKKMAAEDAEDAMIAVAQKGFKTKCYTTDQVKNLSVLFLNDAGKYRFFDLAYPHTSDSNNFNTLESQLSDVYYISRFKAMVRH